MSPAWGLPKEPDTVTELPPWRASPAHHRAVALGALGAVVAVVLRRPDVLVLVTPFLVIATWGQLARPERSGRVQARVGNLTLPEGQATTWTATLDLPPRAEEAFVRVSPGRFVRVDPLADRTAVAAPGGVGVERVIPCRVVRWGRRRVGPGLVAARSPWWAFRTPVVELGAFRVTAVPAAAGFDATVSPHPVGLVGVNRSVRPGSGAEFATIREFHPGDRLRRIHWPSSLRQGQLHVSTTYADQDAHVVLVVDAFSDLGPREGIDGRPTSLDLTVRACASIAQHYLGSGDRVSLRVLGAQDLPRLRTASGPGQHRRILDILSRIEPATDRDRSTVRALEGVPSDSLVIVLSPLVHPAMSGVVAAASARGLTTVVIDTLPDHLVTAPTSRYDALAWRLRILERDEELHALHAAGVPIVTWGGPGSIDLVLRDVARRDRQPRLARR
ncbi:MAG: DUF58 domain-containing protein [Actinomycetales bacterium]|nr:DUF58 domain-containing protein [Candidatus Lutibacillus vidarii]